MDKEKLKEMIDCAKREVKCRYSVYPKLVKSGRMTQDEADKEIKLMYLIQLSLQKIYDGEAPKTVPNALFDTNKYKNQIGWDIN